MPSERGFSLMVEEREPPFYYLSPDRRFIALLSQRHMMEYAELIRPAVRVGELKIDLGNGMSPYYIEHLEPVIIDGLVIYDTIKKQAVATYERPLEWLSPVGFSADSSYFAYAAILTDCVRLR